MLEDNRGMLAVLALKDYDRLCAFDPDLANRLLETIVGRLTSMLPSTRMVAQPDRNHLAVWIAANQDVAGVKRELSALVYALGDRWLDGQREILPEIALRTGQFDAASISPSALLSRTLSSFSVPLVNDVDEAHAPNAPSLAVDELFQLEQDLRQAVARNQLRLQYQPLIDASEGRVCGAEALIRWDHSERGLISPARFVPIMESAELSREIGLWALNCAAREARQWRAMGLSDVRVAVNVSGQQLEDLELPVLIARTLARHGLTGDALEVELTESIALADGDQASKLCATLRKSGIHIAVDDFGTGYSSFASIASVGFDKIKIDRTFVANIAHQPVSQAIYASILALGRGLGIRVLAEGVETAAEYSWLRAHGCRYFQGFYFARPLDHEEFVAFANDKHGLARLLIPNIASPDERLRA